MKEKSIDKEWTDAEKELETRRKEKKRAQALALGVQAVQYLSILNKMGEISPEVAEAKWTKMNIRQKSTVLTLYDKYTAEPHA